MAADSSVSGVPEVAAQRLDERLLEARALVLCGLPLQPTHEIRVTRRTKLGPGRYLTVSFTAGMEGVLLPWGSDRAVLAYLQTRAYKTGWTSFDSLGDFFKAFGMTMAGNNYRDLIDRVERLMWLSVKVREEVADVEARDISPIAFARMPRLARAHDPRRVAMFHAKRYGFELNPSFHEYLMTFPIPLPLEIMRHFRRAPRSWDFAAFLLYRMFAARKPSVIPISELREQLGSSDTNLRRLRQQLGQVIAKMRETFPSIPARFQRGGGLLVEPWQPP